MVEPDSPVAAPTWSSVSARVETKVRRAECEAPPHGRTNAEPRPGVDRRGGRRREDRRRRAMATTQEDLSVFVNLTARWVRVSAGRQGRFVSPRWVGPAVPSSCDALGLRPLSAGRFYSTGSRGVMKPGLASLRWAVTAVTAVGAAVVQQRRGQLCHWRRDLTRPVERRPACQDTPGHSRTGFRKQQVSVQIRVSAPLPSVPIRKACYPEIARSSDQGGAP
jgi:hypothetical protein